MKKGKSKNNGLLPNSLRIISSCLKTVSTNASTVASTVRSAGVSVAATISAASSEDQKDQVTWAGFDRLELGPSIFRNVLLLGYLNGFQVFDVEDASNFSELVSKRDGPVSFLQMQPLPATSNEGDGYRKCHPLLLVVAGEDTNSPGILPNGSHSGGSGKNANMQPQSENSVKSPSAVQFYSLRSHCYVHVLRFRSAVCMVRCSPRIVAVGLATQIYCFDALTLENKFSVLIYPVPQLAGQGSRGVNVGYGPMAVGPRWLAYASNSPLVSNTGRVSPQSFSPSAGVSPSTSPSGSSLVARYAMESSKQLASGIINLGDMGYKTLSKYCHELLPDGSNSPVSSNSGWKVSRAAGTETDNAGMVVVKDFVSKTIISHFKAHTSPISALCFDPSGTLLVTVSIYGNNINIFRILPSCGCSSSGSQNFDWSSSHVHLYKLHRGITSAMIQDICFSHYSQWIAVVSSKGTCHVFVLCPFGGDAGFRILNSQGERQPFMFLVLSLPWWSTSSYTTSQQSFPPPPPIVLSVVSRIKYSSFGWLSTVNGNASSTGKVFVPSGAVAAVFHNSLFHGLHHGNSRTNSLEHLLVYTPSGHVVQHELLPSIGVEQSQGGSGPPSASFVHPLEDELRVKVEPIKWWDVCRRSDWPERDDCILGVSFDGQDLVKRSPDNSCPDEGYKLEFLDINGCMEEKKNVQSYCQKPNERSSWYISNVEVQVSSLRLPIWQKPKICFYVMSCPRYADFAGGEFEIENLPVHEVELRRKELLPVFDHLCSAKSSLNDRVLVGEYPNSTCLGPDHAEEKITEEIVICHSTPASLSSTESSDGGSSRRIENFLDLDQINIDKSCAPIIRSPSDQDKRNIVGSFVLDHHVFCTPSQLFENGDAHVDTPITSGPCMLVNKFPLPKMDSRRDSLASFTGGINKVSDLTSTQQASSIDKAVEGSSVLCDSLDLGNVFQEDHCKELDLTFTQQASSLDKAAEGSSVLCDSLDLGNCFQENHCKELDLTSTQQASSLDKVVEGSSILCDSLNLGICFQEDHCKELDLTSTQQASSLDKVVEGSSVLCDSLDLGIFFQEDHCKALDHDGGDKVTETGTVGVDCNNKLEKIKPKENGEDDDMLGGIFDFPEGCL